MSSNLSPLGVVPGLLELLADRLPEIAFLPETASETLVELFAARHNLQSSQVLAGNGTTEFIYGVPASLGLKKALIVEPTYSDYRRASEWAGMETLYYFLQFNEDFRLDLQRLGEQLTGDELVFICNPNNPTGGFTPASALYQLALDHPQTVFLVDESYISFLPERSLMDFPMRDNLFVLGSFSKVYGIPGLRLGFLASSESRMAALRGRLKPWGVNRLAQVAGEFLLQSADQYVREVVDFLAAQRPGVVAQLGDLPGVQVIPGESHFILCFLNREIRAEELRRRMLEQRIMIRNCENFNGLDDRYFRVSMQSDAKNSRSLQVLRDIL